ncbi:hypothetical protein SAMN05216496_3743 [Pseudomonas sp. Z003-0.4C(8344-21)]|nr:hypothetical protein SAMN05216496_3743 [Pseudomonas sp. Z003-0.4C(8344-21)]
MDSPQHAQISATLEHPPISSLSLWERARVRGFSGPHIISGNDDSTLSKVIGYSRTRAPVAL